MAAPTSYEIVRCPLSLAGQWHAPHGDLTAGWVCGGMADPRGRYGPDFHPGGRR